MIDMPKFWETHKSKIILIAGLIIILAGFGVVFLNPPTGVVLMIAGFGGVIIGTTIACMKRKDRIIWHKKYDEERARLIEEGHKVVISPDNQQVLVSLFEQLANIEQQTLVLATQVFNNKYKCEDAKNLRDSLKSLMTGIPHEISKLIDCSQLLAALKHLAFYNSQTTQHIIGTLNPQQKAYEVMQLIVKNIITHAKWLNTAFQNEQISQETRQNCLEYLHTAIDNFTKNLNDDLLKPLLDAISGVSNVINAMRQITTSDSIEHLNTAMIQVNVALEQIAQVSDITQPEPLAESTSISRETSLSSSDPSTVDVLNTFKP